MQVLLLWDSAMLLHAAWASNCCMEPGFLVLGPSKVQPALLAGLELAFPQRHLMSILTRVPACLEEYFLGPSACSISLAPDQHPRTPNPPFGSHFLG